MANRRVLTTVPNTRPRLQENAPLDKKRRLSLMNDEAAYLCAHVGVADVARLSFDLGLDQGRDSFPQRDMRRLIKMDPIKRRAFDHRRRI